MKWCRRVSGLVGSSLADSNAKHVASRIRELAFIEAVDCFSGAVQNDALRDFIVFVIGFCWEVSVDRIIHLTQQERPSVNASATTFTVGRASLPVNKPDATGSRDTVFAYTRHTLELIERVAQSLRHDEPVLLVGETGAGKTSTIQHLARQVNTKLVVIVRAHRSVFSPVSSFTYRFSFCCN
jgi:midasin